MQKLERSLPSILLSLAGSIGLYCLTPLTPATGQIAPDSTLDAESSIVTPNANVRGLPASLIEGGATRGENLFHSFSDFNVGEGLRVYFANPVGIENILTRVTGSNVSNILGTLGVDGTANLFLLNPNGISFGPNARLDIGGSFFASTASSFKFSDGSEFSATNPQAPPLLTVKVTPGVQWGASKPGATITNRGNLAPQQDLTLVADTLDLQGQLLSGRDLTLFATDTVKVRDSAASPFIASAGSQLLVQGNRVVDIFALNHPESGLFSGADMVLRSANTVGGDAHYWSGGSFRIEKLDGNLGNLNSPKDPIIFADGDVSLGDYTGASLHILAGGSVTLGNVEITGTDSGENTINPNNPDLFLASLATVQLSDGTTLTIDGSAKPTLDVRAGIDWTTFPGGAPTIPIVGTVTPSPTFGGGATRADISVNGYIWVFQPDGVVLLTNQYRPNGLAGNISTQGIDTSSWNVGNGGSITINSRGNITADYLDSYSESFSGSVGNGGAITLIAANDINIAYEVWSYSYSYSGNAGQGGAINLSAANGSVSTGSLDSSSYSVSGSAGQGGAISLSATNGSISTDFLYSSSYSYSGNTGQGGAINWGTSTDSGTSVSTGNGGAINLSAVNGNISTGDLNSYSKSDWGTSTDSGTSVSTGNGGAINLSATNGSISTGSLYSYSDLNPGWGTSVSTGNGGAVNLSATNGSISTGDLNSYSKSPSGNTGNGGAINLSAVNGSISTDYVISYSHSSSGWGSVPSTGQGGAIALTAGGSISTKELDSSSSSFSLGNGGAIALIAGDNINTANLNSGYVFGGSLPSGFSLGNGGAITLIAGNNITTAYVSSNSNTISMFSDDNYSGNGGNGGEITLIAGGNIITADIESFSYSFSEFGPLGGDAYSGNGGEITLTAGGNINTGNISSSSTSWLSSYFGSHSSYSRNGGEIVLTAAGNITTGGIVSLSKSEYYSYSYFIGNVIFSQSDSSYAGNGGKITLTAGGNIITDALNSYSYSSSYSDFYSPFSYSGNGGEIVMTAAGNITTGDLYSFSYSRPGNAASGGAISLSARGGDISGQGNQSTVLGSFSISEQGTGGNGGNVTLEAKNKVSNLEILTLSSSSKSGTVQVTGLGDLLLTNTDILTSKQVTIPDPFRPGEFITLNVGGEGQSGDVAVINPGNLTFNNSSIQSDTKGSDPAGNVTISSSGLVSFINSQIISSTSSTGQAGSIILKAPQVQLDSSSRLFAQTSSSGRAGNLTLQPYNNGQTLTVNLQEGAQISASTSSAGQGGSLTVTAPESVTISGNGILSATADASSTGIAGDVLLTTPRLTVANGARVSASTNSTNTSAIGGNLTVQSSQVNLTGGSSLSAGTTGAAAGGNLTIQPFSNESTLGINLQDGSVVSASTTGAGKGGSLIVTAPESVTLSGNGQLSVETSGTGQAGDVTLATETLNIENGAKVSATATAKATSSAQGGSISANTSQVNLSGTGGGLFAETQGIAPAGSLTLQPYNNGQSLRINFQDDTKISASTSSNGQGGSLIVTAPESVILSGNGQLSAETNSTGQAGSATINTRHLTVQDRAQVSVSTSGTGQGGNLQVNASDSVLLNNQGSLVTESSGSGAAGDLTINTRELTLDNSAKVSTSTLSSQGGDITLQELNTLAVSNNSQISTATQTGQAGSLRVNANSNPAAWVQVSDNSRLSAQATQAGGDAGEVNLNTRQLTLENNSQISAANVSGVSEGIRLEGLDTLRVNNSLISASTETGTAGGLSVNATQSVDLSGTGGLSVEATEGGIAGDLTVTTGQMSVREGAKVTVSSPSGQAGNLNISANSLFLNRGTLSAETGTSSNEGGANINLSGLEFLLMGNESLISANARGDANGGNITINSTFIIATPPTGSQGSDIVANAVYGNGGRVSLTTQGLFGIEFRPLRTPKNDITVRSEFGLTGVFQRNSPDVDPSRGLTNLPAEFVDASTQITQNCPARGSRSESSFTITGTGGLPPRPGDAFDSPFPTGTIRSLPGSSTSSNESPSAVAVTNPVELNSPTLNRSNTTNSHTPLVEAAGWMYSSKGEVILTAQAPTFTPHGSWSTPPTCD